MPQPGVANGDLVARDFMDRTGFHEVGTATLSYHN